MNKLGITLAAWLTTITIGMPLALQPIFIQADQTIEGCHWSDPDWVYQNGSKCRGTGEDPTVNKDGSPACSTGMAMIDDNRVTCVQSVGRGHKSNSKGS